ncbi:MAG: class I SAM-dependent methyltransferase [Phycisphaerales bacterium JB038]
MSALKQIARTIVPENIRRPLREWHRARVFRRAMRDYLADPSVALSDGGGLLRRLVYGWGNETFSALGEYLVACLREALQGEGPILECGSGLSTILVGIVAQRTGRQLWTLEHHEGWGERVRAALAVQGVDAVEVCIAPLRAYTEEYSWYDPPLERMPNDFGLVICDGPPGDTPGGRYGMLPVMRERLAPGCTILLDDAWREYERDIAQRWADELGTDFSIEGEAKPYLRLRK